MNQMDRIERQFAQVFPLPTKEMSEAITKSIATHGTTFISGELVPVDQLHEEPKGNYILHSRAVRRAVLLGSLLPQGS